ncbi:MAG: MFS transporter, partial [Planctomycetes bacterium]|nr:MFS transporter [Planctomycetota bacterium]
MPRKILVAVHGIGEQMRCRTIQMVARQVFQFFGQPATIAAGRLHARIFALDAAAPALGFFTPDEEIDPRLPGEIDVAFGEVYWSDIPRGPAADQFTIEEIKRWAGTVVERVRLFEQQKPAKPRRTDKDYALAASVIGEMIEGLNLFEKLLFLASKANIFQFDLKKLLVDYLGDVQIVTEFSNFRAKILRHFHEVLSRIASHPDNREAELYLVAHSEGTVLSFLGILEALNDGGKGNYAWVRRLRGFMTIGSPINKHVLLWPELWRHMPPPPEDTPIPPIAWRNYYDHGDPIGFQLDRTRQWLEENGWSPFFEFKKGEHDYGFTRYWFPGKAHDEYWTDPEVFGHFLENVVFKEQRPETPRFQAAPANRRGPRLV